MFADGDDVSIYQFMGSVDNVIVNLGFCPTFLWNEVVAVIAEADITLAGTNKKTRGGDVAVAVLADFYTGTTGQLQGGWKGAASGNLQL